MSAYCSLWTAFICPKQWQPYRRRLPHLIRHALCAWVYVQNKTALFVFDVNLNVFMDLALELLREIALEWYFGLVRVDCQFLQQSYQPLIEYLLLKLNYKK